MLFTKAVLLFLNKESDYFEICSRQHLENMFDCLVTLIFIFINNVFALGSLRLMARDRRFVRL